LLDISGIVTIPYVNTRRNPLTAKIRLINQSGSGDVFESRKEEFSIGRSKECDFTVEDPYASRIQAKVFVRNGKYFIENLGKNPVTLNGAHIREATPLNAGDLLTLGATTLHCEFEAEVNEAVVGETAGETLLSNGTVIFTQPPQKEDAPRLLYTGDSGETAYPLTTKNFSIGRHSDADLYLEDSSVSRRHCGIENRDDFFWVINFSQTNPTQVNGQTITEQRLYHGDRLQVGGITITFLSDRPEDVRPAEEKFFLFRNRFGLVALISGAALVLIVGAFLLYAAVIKPWQVNRTLRAVADRIESGVGQPSADKLKALLAKDLSAAQESEARMLLAKAVLNISESLFKEGHLKETKEYLIEYLKMYGVGEEAMPVWNRLDLVHLALGRKQQDAADYPSALKEYSAIREDSPYFDEAQKAVRGVWLLSQQQSHQNQSVAELLKQAEEHFQARRYLTPVNRNAFPIYQKVLALDPNNPLALKRIGQMKEFYRDTANRFFAKENWAGAVTYFERYSVIDPDDMEIRKKIRIARDKLTLAQKAAGKAKVQGPDAAAQREKIKRLLEESGAEGSVMKYLFEEPAGEKVGDTPW